MGDSKANQEKQRREFMAQIEKLRDHTIDLEKRELEL